MIQFVSYINPMSTKSLRGISYHELNQVISSAQDYENKKKE